MTSMDKETNRLGLAASGRNFIEEAIRLRTRAVRNVRLRLLAQEAMADSDFVADMRETNTAYRDAISMPAR